LEDLLRFSGTVTIELYLAWDIAVEGRLFGFFFSTTFSLPKSCYALGAIPAKQVMLCAG
jgi:hypothetical protein